MAKREDVEIPSGQHRLATWLYRAQSSTPSKPGPALVMAHGLGGTRDMKLDAFAEEFLAMGYTCILFDYRCNGDSPGLPRGLIDWSMQQEDWHAAIKYTRDLDFVDADSVGLFGTSFSGGHVIQVAAADPRIKAVISQCPFTSGYQSALCCGLTVLPSMGLLGMSDSLFGTDKKPVTVKLVGKPGERALLNAPDVMSGYKGMIPAGKVMSLDVPARIIMSMLWLRPGKYAKDVQCPIIFGICARDSVAPAKTSLADAERAPKGVVKNYEDMGHFDIYEGEKHVRAFADYAEFLKSNLPISS